MAQSGKERRRRKMSRAEEYLHASPEDYHRIVYMDNYLKRQLWHLGLVVLKLRKAAKAWHIRFELIKKLSVVERFLANYKPPVRLLSQPKPTKDNMFEEVDASSAGAIVTSPRT